MRSPTTLSRIWISSIPLQALCIGLGATVISTLLWFSSPATLTALDYTVFDSWLLHRHGIPVNPSLAIVSRDPASEERFGSGRWDRAILAQLVVAIHEAGAAAIGIDHRLDHASPAQVGGAASDALLLEALRAASPVVLVHATDSLLQSDAAVSAHLEVEGDGDHVSRHISLSARVGAQTIPAFAVALFDIFQRRNASSAPFSPDHARATVLVNVAGDGSLAALQPLRLSAVWETIQRQDAQQLASWFKDKIVVIRSSPTSSETRVLASGAVVDGMTVHLHLLNALLNHQPIASLGRVARLVIATVLGSVVAWSLLRFRGTNGFLLATGAVALYGALTVASLSLASLVLPVALPLTASLLAFMGATALVNLTASRRLMLLECDMIQLQKESTAVREALILREDRAEALQEDLAAAHATIAHSAGQREELTATMDALRLQIVEAQQQEEEARGRLEQLERQLADLRAAALGSHRIADAELERIQAEARRCGIITQDRALLRLFHDLKKAAKSPLSILLLGEPGTGKELFARAIHLLSPRSAKAFVPVNMAAISPELFESELFGHMKGSFTGATADRRGYFGLADHGTIFLDEIGDLRMDHQSKLLRVLQDRTFYRVGATTQTTVDVRIVAATNRDLQRGVSEGWFREDLYFRLTGLVFHLPLLRQRPGDIPLLADIFLGQIAGEMGKPVPKLTNDALRALVEHEWKGNVRELRHCLEQAVTLNDGSILTKDSLRLREKPPRVLGQTRLLPPESAGDAAVLACLREHRFDMQATAAALGWDRSTVTQHLKGLCFQTLVETGGDQAKAAQVIAGDPSHVRTAELKLRDYYGHLQSVIEPFSTAEEALAECRRRFKNLPERHFLSVERLIGWHFEQNRPMRFQSIQGP
jgi:transcriptional regulator with PAS, ATPase and Fis domain/CHASE2 domain-containing sensor protein